MSKPYVFYYLSSNFEYKIYSMKQVMLLSNYFHFQTVMRFEIIYHECTYRVKHINLEVNKMQEI